MNNNKGRTIRPTTTNSMATKRDNFLQYANEIKSLGYKVYVIDNNDSNYGFIVNGRNEIGYFQLTWFGEGIHLSTMHKPCHFGTGFSCSGGVDDYITELTTNAIDEAFAQYPSWVLDLPRWEKKRLNEVHKYKADEYLANYWNKQNLVEL